MNISIEKIKFSDLTPIKKNVERANMKLEDSKNTTWFGAKYDGKLVGIAAFRQKKDVIFFKSTFVLEEYRRTGIFRQLFEEKMKHVTLLRPSKIVAYCTPMSVQHYLNNGFQVVNRKGSVTIVEKKFPQGVTKIDFPPLLSESKGLNISIEQIKFSDLTPIKKNVERANMKLQDTENTTWLGAKHDGKLVGITAYTQKKDVILFISSYVLEDYRRNGIYRQLFEERMKQATLLWPRKIIGYCTRMSVQHYLNNGFQVVNQRKGITHVEKNFPQGDTTIDFPTLLSSVNGQLVYGEAFDIFHITDQIKFLNEPNTLIFIRENLSDTDWKKIKSFAPSVVVLQKEKVPQRFLPSITYISVDDMETAYWNFVRYYRSMFNIPVFAITGTCGKTTTKEMITHILQHKHNVQFTRKSNNSFYRNLTYLCGITKETDAAVFETPVGRPGLLAYHCQYYQPTIGMITNIGIDHLKQCGTLENYIQAKGEILQGLNYKGTLLLNSDDERTKAISLHPYKGKVIYFGVHSPADYRADQIQYGINGMNFTLHYNNMEYPVFVPGYGEHQVYNALSAVAAVHQIGIEINEAADQLKTFKNVKGHLEILQGPNESMIINDTWSSNPTSIEASLKVLQEIAHNKKKVVILGSVSWLGENEAEIHREIGKMLANYPIDLLLAFGEFSNEIILGAKSQNMEGEMILCQSAEEIENQLLPLLNKDTAVLIKTSMHDKSKTSLVSKLNKGR